MTSLKSLRQWSRVVVLGGDAGLDVVPRGMFSGVRGVGVQGGVSDVA
ncbi:hypothetical protein [Williamsia muralis]|nr:hypothetical protein [Williamsia marianensis]